MEAPVAALSRDLDALRDAWSGGVSAFGGATASDAGAATARGGAAASSGAAADHGSDAFGETDPSAGFDALSDDGLVRVTDALSQARRDIEALLAQASAEVARRSRRELGAEGLAKQRGFHNPARLIASATGGSTGDASKLIAVGTATADRTSFVGERLPARHPHVAVALRAGTISVDAAAAITGMLERVRLRSDRAQAEQAESVLAVNASTLTLEQLHRAVKHAEAWLDPDGVAPRNEELREERSLTIREERGGMVVLRARLDPVTAAPVKAAIDAFTTDALRSGEPDGSRGATAGADATERRAPGAPRSPGATVGGIDPLSGTVTSGVAAAQRTIPQLQADALAALARHVIGCSEASAPLARTTVVVRVDLADLQAGTGVATIDGIDQPIPAGAVRRMAADAEVIPAVMGGDSVPLDLGRAARLFTREQRLALAERDCGCASCGQNVTWAEAHHIRWWERDAGPTDLDNGVMLCSFCHHSVHREGWGVSVRDGTVWFVPPPHVDAARRPRLGGRARFEVPARVA
ncbi:HNH endonuclease signature motif containing protein [Agromyces sp. SYSU T00194]|uniref:HNH endonuclease signature motif containing protein n=1 Tax=Agromyces chitinivorans TaxID=3158560 RepID=UPI003399E0E6